MTITSAEMLATSMEERVTARLGIAMHF